MREMRDDPRSQTDPTLVARLADGDGEALAVLYARYRFLVFGCLCRLTPDRSMAEDLLQETFLAAFQSAGRYRGQGSVRSWVVGIARNQAHNCLRKRIPSLVHDAVLDQVCDPGLALDEVAFARVRLAEVVSVMRTLSPIHQEILYLVFRHQFSMVELAGALEIPVGTAKSRLSHARRALLDAMENGEAG